jgi:TolA-binding protein
MHRATQFVICSSLLIAMLAPPAFAQKKGKSKGPVRGSIVEDRAARKMLEAGDARFDSDEHKKAVEIWQSILERYPRSKVRFAAHMRLAKYLLERERAYDQARTHYEVVASEENTDQEQRAEATLKMGRCFFEAGNYGRCFKVMREVIEKYPVSEQVNRAYYYIGLGHFKLGHYSRAIQALEKVGTTLSNKDKSGEKVEAGKRLFVKIEDADLAALETDEKVKIIAKATSGDSEIIECLPVGRNVRVVLGSIVTQLGKPHPNNGVLEIRGNDKIVVTYVDRHTADQKFDRKVLQTITVVGNGLVQITDGAFGDTLNGVVLGKEVNLQITDADFDLTDKADTLKAAIEVYREKTDEEIETELSKLLAESVANPNSKIDLDEEGKPKIDRFKRIDRVEVTLNEAAIQTKKPETQAPKASEKPKTDAAEPEGDLPGLPGEDKAKGGESSKDFLSEIEKDSVDKSIHSGVFRISVPLVKEEKIDEKDSSLQALPGDSIRLSFVDERNISSKTRLLVTAARAVEGNLGGVRVTRTEITDQQLRLSTRLKTAGALTNIGNRYKEFGLKTNADTKYKQALMVCDEIMIDARKLRGGILEDVYVQLWKIYYAMDKLEMAAAMSQRLQREFPNSAFVDDAMLSLANISRKRGDLNRAVGLYSRLARMKNSQLQGEAQFGIAECYEQMAREKEGPARAQMFDRAFQEYKKVFDQFPESGRVGEAVSKMANFYYVQKDYARAVDVFETVLSDHPDAKFLDVILFNYGRCLYRMNRKRDARKQFDQLISEFPESALAGDAKRITEALAKGGF